MSLTSLPILPLEEIVSYLDYFSLVSLAASASSLAHLHPKKQLVKGEDFSVVGINPRSRRGVRVGAELSEKREHDPEPYFDVEVKNQGLLAIKMAWEWEGKVCKGELTKNLFTFIFSGCSPVGAELEVNINILPKPSCGFSL